jgi:PcfJ-like protein
MATDPVRRRHGRRRVDAAIHRAHHEGRALHHCVASYAVKCVRGAAAIWSLRRRFGQDCAAKPVLTVEVAPRDRAIVRMRGYANRRPSGRLLEIVRMWAARERLRFHGALEKEFGRAVE